MLTEFQKLPLAFEVSKGGAVLEAFVRQRLMHIDKLVCLKLDSPNTIHKRLKVSCITNQPFKNFPKLSSNSTNLHTDGAYICILWRGRDGRRQRMYSPDPALCDYAVVLERARDVS